MNQHDDSGKKNLPGVAPEPRNNSGCWLLSHTAPPLRDAPATGRPPRKPDVHGLSRCAAESLNQSEQTLSRLFFAKAAGGDRSLSEQKESVSAAGPLYLSR